MFRVSMNRRRNRRSIGLLLAAAVPAIVIVLTSGCGKKEEKTEILSLEGKVQKVQANADGTGEITVSYFNEKQKQEMVGVGRVTRETEILINGAAATLKDVKAGDRVRGQARVEKKEGKVTLTALKMQVDRAGG